MVEKNTKMNDRDQIKKMNEIEDEEEIEKIKLHIEKLFEEKEIKNNMTVANVKVLIREVLTDSKVQSLYRRHLRKSSGEDGHSSDDDTYYEPKLTRSKKRELLGSQNPIVNSKDISSEDDHHRILIAHEDLTEDSDDDEEYIPKNNEIEHSDDESHISDLTDIGSPLLNSTPTKSRRSTSVSQKETQTPKRGDDSIFKEPLLPNSSQCNINDSAIWLRTRSKVQLLDTPIENLEMQLIPPDITPEMYDWGESDNEDYLAFLKEFVLPPSKNHNETHDDEEADPEYNVMEDEEDQDLEELRVDRAVKVSKKELNELIAELAADFEHHHNNPEELIQRPKALLNNAAAVTTTTSTDTNANDSKIIKTIPEMNTPDHSPIHETDSDYTLVITTNDIVENGKENKAPKVSKVTKKLIEQKQKELESFLQEEEEEKLFKDEPLFNPERMARLQDQMQRHVQLLAQTYVLNAQQFEDIAEKAKTMIVELKQTIDVRSTVIVNLIPAWNLVNSWPKPDKKVMMMTPIKKRILEERYLNDHEDLEKFRTKDGRFPYHIIKLIFENKSFIYGDMLPKLYIQNSNTTVYFTPGEDSLIVLGLDELRNKSLNLKEKVSLLQEKLISARTSRMIYDRIRNTKKKTKKEKEKSSDITTKKKRDSNNTPLIIEEYIVNGKLPSLPTFIPIDLNRVSVPKDMPEEQLNDAWQKFKEIFDEISKSGLKDAIKKVGRNCVKIQNSEQLPDGKRKKAVKNSDNNDLNNNTNFSENQNNMNVVPLNDSEGKVIAYVHIPQIKIIEKNTPNTPQKKELKDVKISDNSEPDSPVIEIKSKSSTKINSNNKTIKKEVGAFENTLVINEENSPCKSETTILLDDDEEEDNDNPSTPMSKATSTATTINEINDSEQVNINFKTPVIKLRSNNSARTWPYNINSPKLKRTVEYCSASEMSEIEEVEEDFYMEDENIEITEISYEEKDNLILNNENVVSVIEIDLVEAVEGLEKAENYEGEKTPKDSGDKGGGGSSGRRDSHSNNNNNNKSQNQNSSGKNTNPGSRTRTTSSSLGGGGGGRRKNDDDDEEDRDDKNRHKRVKNLPEDKVNFSEEEKPNPKKKEKEEKSSNEGVKKNSTVKNNKEKLETPTRNRRLSKQEGGGGDPLNSGPSSGGVAFNSSSSSSKKCLLKDLSKEKEKNQRKSKKSPTSGKNYITPVSRMLDDGDGGMKEASDNVSDSYAENFLHKVQAQIEVTNPVLYSNFINTISDYVQSNGAFTTKTHLYLKVEKLLKDYPKLIEEFLTVLTVEDAIGINRFPDYLEKHASISFMEQLEKLALVKPQQKTKIIQKLKSLKEANSSEEEIVNSMIPLLKDNPLLLNAFTAMFPAAVKNLHLEETITTDYETIDDDMMDVSVSSQKDTSTESIDHPVETVKLPDEKDVPCTSSCPCICHSDNVSPNAVFLNRSKHCHRCSIKFQDGKILAHSGKMLKPVNVHFKDSSTADKIQQQDTCSNCLLPNTTPTSSNNNPLNSKLIGSGSGCNKSNFKESSSNNKKGTPPSNSIKHHQSQSPCENANGKEVLLTMRNNKLDDSLEDGEIKSEDES